MNFIKTSKMRPYLKPKILLIQSRIQRKTLHIPSEVEMTVFFYEELSKYKTKAVVLRVVEHYSKNYILPSRNIQTRPGLFDANCMNVSYNRSKFFSHPISSFKLHVSVRGNQPTLSNLS